MIHYSTENITGFYMPQHEFDAACDAIDKAWEQAGMPDNYQAEIEDHNQQAVQAAYQHVTGSDGKPYAQLTLKVVKTQQVLSQDNITAL